MRNFDVKLCDVATIIMGTSPKGEYYNNDGIGLPLLNGPTEFGAFHPTCTLFTTDSRKECKKGDLIFCVRGSTTGRMNWADQVYSLGRGVCSIRGKTPLETKFIKYCLDYNLKAMLKLAGGGTFPNLTKDDIFSFSIPYPKSRQKIASILSAYDDLIENNTRRIAILEEMAQLIYREWFVHFRFPGHEQIRMVDSEIGPVPEGWKIGRLDDALILQRGFDLPKKKRTRGFVPVYAATGITDYHDKAKCKAPGVLTGRSGSLGTVIYADRDFWPLNTTLWVKEFRHATPLYAFFLLTGMELEKFNSGAAVPTLNRNDIHGLPVVLPSSEKLQQFDDIVLPMFELKRVLLKRNSTLRQTRDLLLPRLISGELDVSELDIDIGDLA